MRAHFILFVRDPKRSRDFYEAVLGASPTLDVPGMTEFSLGGAVLGLMPEAGIERLLEGQIAPREGTQPRAELYLVVDDARAAFERAVSAGARVLSPPTLRDWGHVAGYALDLDGHVLALANER